MKPLLSIRQTAENLGVSPFTIRAEIYRGKLACVRVGRRVLVDPIDLASYRALHRTPSQAQNEIGQTLP